MLTAAAGTPNPANRAPTLAHVAKLAGVSPATASRVLSGSARVSRAARLQVEEAVERLGYVRRGSATRTSASTGAIAAVLCADSTRVFADPFYAALLWGMRRELDGGAQLVILMVGKHREWRVAADYLRGEHLAGVLLVGARQDDPTALVHAAAGVPVLLAGRPLTDVPLPYVDVDNRGGAQAAVRHLFAAGRRTIATIAGPADLGAGVDRLAGYRLAAAEAGLNVTGLIAHGDFGRPSGEHAMARLLARRPDLDAVLAASDPMALGALEALRRAGRRVPDDVAVIGFDDAPIAQRVRPRLTTVRQPVEDFGARLIRELRALIAGRPITDRGVVLKTKLIVRDSA
ncbi:LacI family DNA-binding transcriptional regulator [Actinomadura barringtoniae]|uniref:LacI family DNA-binding transcriptional regulator n=1 Tax=Actinomadura barringtoniae TaxID=1427535 RepID=A0A939P9W3_9ACTN|nr:LacI family DNA-binding transcriptional regulator [Actinomadura barringtoniae]